MPGNPALTPKQDFDQQDVPDAADLQAHQHAQADPAHRAGEAIAANPGLQYDPQGLLAFLAQPYADGAQTGQVAKFAGYYGAINKGLSMATVSPNAAAIKATGGLFHWVSGAWDSIRHSVASIPRATLNEAERFPQQVGGAAAGVPSALEGMGKAAWHDATQALPHYFERGIQQNVINTQEHGVVGGIAASDQPYIDTAKAVGGMAKRGLSRLATTSEELGTAGVLGPGGLGNIKANYADAAQTIGNFANATVNPWTTFRNMAHTIAFTESLAHRKGWGIALQTMLPYYAMAMGTHMALTGVTAAAGAAETAAMSQEAATVVEKFATEAEAAGTQLTPEQEAMIAQAKQVLGNETPVREAVTGAMAPVEGEKIPGNPVSLTELEGKTTTNRLFRGASAVTNVVTKPLQAVARVAHVIGAPGRDVTNNVMYSMLHAGMSNDPANSALWDLTKNGVPVDENNHPMGSVGSVLTSYLGLPKGTLADVISAPVNVYANWLGADALGAFGSIIGRTRTFYSTGGIIGRNFSGLGIRDGEDVYRVFTQYARVRRAVQWIANHSESQINEVFRGLFIGDSGKVVLKALGDARTPEAVMKVFADMAQGIGYVHNVAPTMSFYELTKASFNYGDRAFTVGKALEAPVAELKDQAAAIEEQTGFKVLPPDSANFAVATGPVGAAVRERSIMGAFFSKRFARMMTYFNEATGKMEDFDLNPRSPGAIAAIGDQLRAMGAQPSEIAMIGDQLLSATPEQFNRLVLNNYHDVLMKLFYANAKYSVLDSVKVAVSKDLRQQLEDWMGATTSGTTGVMAGGEKGIDASFTVGDGVEKNSALGETHQAVLHFARTRDLQGWAKWVSGLSDAMTHPQDGLVGIDQNLSVADLEAKANFAGATLDGMWGRITSKLGSLSPKLVAGSMPDALEQARSDAYDAKNSEIAQAVRETFTATRGTSIEEQNKTFVQVYDRIRKNLDTTRRINEIVDEWNFASKFGSATNPHEVELQLQELNAKLPPGYVDSVDHVTPEMAAKLRGEKAALEDAAAEMQARLQKNAIGIRELRERVGLRNPKIDPAVRDQMTKDLQSLRERNPRYRNRYQAFIDGTNYYISKVWAPLALYSGGWALRVGNNEMLQNTFRTGGASMLQAKILTSYVKHETGQAVFTSRLANLVDRWMSKDLFRGSYADMLRRRDLSFSHKLISSTGRVAAGVIIGMRDLAGGVLHGIEGNLITWTPRTERMVQRVTEAINDYAPGGLPMGVHSSGGVLADDAVQSHLLFGEQEDGKSITSAVHQGRTFAGTNPGDRNYYRGLRGALTRIHDDRFLLPSMLAMQKNVLADDLTVLTAQEADAMMSDMSEAALKHIEAQTPDTLENFDRHFRRSKMFSNDQTLIDHMTESQKLRLATMTPEEQAQFLNHVDWAHSIAYNDFHTVTGTNVGGGYVIHRDLLEQAVTGQVKPVNEIRMFIDGLPRTTEPKNIPTEVHNADGAETLTRQIAKAVNLPGALSDQGFRAFLGPMVNAYVRDPVYMGIYDDFMEQLQPMVDRGFISEDVQKIRSHENAVVKMSKFVHNPQERTVFEGSMRAYAPFYFAQNQSWRRVMRIARDNPGAAEKYMRMSLAVTNFVSVKGQNGNVPVNIPTSEWMGNIASLGNGFSRERLGPLSFGLAGSVGSISSIIPTGSVAGTGVLENIARPSWGPLVTVTLREVFHYLGLGHIPFANKVLLGALGPVASRSSLRSEILPSSFFQNAYNDVEGIFNQANSSFGSVQIWVLNNAVDDLSASYYDPVKKLLMSQHVPEAVASNIASQVAETKIAQFFNINTNRRQLQQFMNQVHMSAAFMYTVKTAIGFISPLALSVQGAFSKDAEFQKLLTEKLPNGQLRYTFDQAASIFAIKFPNHVYDLVAHTQPIGSAMPETQQALSLMENSPYVVTQYHNAAAYLVPQAGTFNAQAFQMELDLGLRQRYGVMGGSVSRYGDYVDALLIANGNHYYYDHLMKEYPEVPGNQGYQNYKARTAAAKQYGLFDNPTWYGNFSSGGGRWATEASAINQMEQMLADKNVPDSVYGGTHDKLLYEVLIGAYSVRANAYRAAQTSREKYNIEQSWYTEMTTLSQAKQTPPALSYFITAVLRNLPTAKN